MKRSKIRLILGSLAATAVLSFAVVALANNPHFTNNISWDGSTASGKVAGLGNDQDAGVKLTVTVSYDCLNPAGKKVEPHSDVTSAFSPIDTADRNGSYDFSVTANVGTGGCPNRKWTQVNLTRTALLELVVGGQTVDTRNF